MTLWARLDISICLGGSDGFWMGSAGAVGLLGWVSRIIVPAGVWKPGDVSVSPGVPVLFPEEGFVRRSEEHTSELQSLMRISYAVFCLKKKKNKRLKYLYNILCNEQR